MRLVSYLLAAVAGTAVVAGGILLGIEGFRGTRQDAREDTVRIVSTALDRLDPAPINRMIFGGWDPNDPVDGEGNNAVHYVLKACARPHDAGRLFAMVETLYNAGNRLDVRNAAGQTPYSLALAGQYCGARHPVTALIRRNCFEGFRPGGDNCLAAGEGARGGGGVRPPV